MIERTMAAENSLVVDAEQPDKIVNDSERRTNPPENKELPRTITGWKVTLLLYDRLALLIASSLTSFVYSGLWPIPPSCQLSYYSRSTTPLWVPTLVPISITTAF